MTGIFIVHSTTDARCAEQVSQGLQAKGYTTWQAATSLQMSDITNPRREQEFMLGSAAFILLWSGSAAKSETVEQQLLFAQRLKKTVIAVLLDNEPLPGSLTNIPSIPVQTSCDDIVPRLLQQPLLPSVGSTDPLIVLWERAASELLRARKEAVDDAAGMLAQNQQREAVLALLEFLAGNDLMDGVRTKAREAIDADTKRQMPVAPPSPFKPQDAAYIFGVRCKNGHITYFDKRIVCKQPISKFHRIVRVRDKNNEPEELDELDLECSTCHEPLVVSIDCRGCK